MKSSFLPLCVCLFLYSPCPTLALAGQPTPDSFRLRLSAPIERWDEAIPLGNGLTGGLLWGEGNSINLSLDRGDLWDERLPNTYLEEDWNYATIRRLQAEANQKEISRRFDAPYHEAAPTKLPGGRLVIKLDQSQQARSFTLDMQSAVGGVEFDEGALACFFSAVEPIAMLRIPGPPVSLEIIRPAGLDKLNYQPADFGNDNDLVWMVQKAAGDLNYAVVVATRRSGNESQIAVAITTTRDGRDPLAIGKKRVANALTAGFDAMLAAQRRWWTDFWAISSVTIPNARLARHYNLVKYFYGAASRPDAPPMPLQGVWTRDDGNLPPWKGDYHHDLNTQMTYLAYHTAGLVDAGRSFVNYNWELLPAYRRFARDFYGVQGAAMPAVATLAGKPTGGWSQYSLSPTNALWVGQTFYLHWRYTMDHRFLAERAYPWLSEIATGIVNLLEERDGKLYLPLSSSPEIYDNTLRAWLTPNSNYDLSLMQWTFEALAEMADALDKQVEATRWRSLRTQLDDLLVDDDAVLMFAKDEPFNVSHRHHSHAMAIHPLSTLNVDGTDRDRTIIHATIDRMQQLGTQAWVGYSFSWFACMLARAGRADEALTQLEDYERAFILRNGFHANGDQIGAGLSRFRYRPFTLEGNFLAMQAVHEMLLQSWGDRIRVFPAVPNAWSDASFEHLRAEGGLIVSAHRRHGKTISVALQATVDRRLRLQNPFGGAPFHASHEMERHADELRCQLRAGHIVKLRVGRLSDGED